MDHSNHAATLQPAYDIFENSSPQRPITSHGEPLPPDNVAEVLHSTNQNVVNFSRKREFHGQRGAYDQKSEHGSKRHRYADWPAERATPSATAEDVQDDEALSPIRVSKFREGSMNDRPSEAPPSLFTRRPNKHVSASVEELMDDYHKDNDKPLPPYPNSRETLARVAKSPARKRHVKDMEGGPILATPSQQPVDEEEAPSSGIFKFGKSMASAFNPLNMWSKLWRGGKEEAVAEEVHDPQKMAMLERQRKAEQAYAELKQAGKLGTQGSHAVGKTPVYAPGYTQPASDVNPRDSAISMGTTSRTSIESSKGSKEALPEESPRKSRHGRTPSFHDLKKIPSAFNLHRRSASTSRSPEKVDKNTEDEQPERMRRSISRSNLFGAEEMFSSLRSSKSKVNLTDSVDEFGMAVPKKGKTKQAKLTKRVSDLEAKLEFARKELERALGTDAPPVPVLSPPASEHRPLPPRPEARHSKGNKVFVPALPTLLSESLLIQPPAESSAQADGIKASKSSAKDDALQESHANAMYTRQNQPLLKGEFTDSPPAKENVPGTPESKDDRPLPAAPLTPGDEAALISSQQADTPKKTPSKLHKKTPNKKKRASKDDKVYRPGSEVDDDAEWAAAVASKPATKKKRKSDEGIADEAGSPKRAKSSRLPVSSTETKRASSKITKPMPHNKELPLPPASAAGLETVHENHQASFTSIVPVKKSSPHRPTAKATPAFPHSRRGASSSPLRVTPKKQKRRSRESRSKSPPPSSGRLKFLQAESGMDRVVTARPGVEVGVPDLPSGGGLGSEGSFEWDDDVF